MPFPISVSRYLRGRGFRRRDTEIVREVVGLYAFAEERVQASVLRPLLLSVQIQKFLRSYIR